MFCRTGSNRLRKNLNDLRRIHELSVNEEGTLKGWTTRWATSFARRQRRNFIWLPLILVVIVAATELVLIWLTQSGMSGAEARTVAYWVVTLAIILAGGVIILYVRLRYICILVAALLVVCGGAALIFWLLDTIVVSFL